MGFNEDLIKLRAKLVEAVRLGVVEGEGADIYQATLINVLAESEKRRQECVKEMERLRGLLTNMEGQERAFGQVGYLLFQIIDGYIVAAQKSAREEAAMKEEMDEKKRMAAEALKALEAPEAPANDSPPPEEKRARKRTPKAQDAE